MRRTAVAVALMAGMIIPAIGAAPVHAEPPHDTGIGIRLAEIPKAEADNPRARAYIVDHVKPGSVIERRIEVVNHSPRAQRVRLYPAAASVEKGGFVGARGATQNELSSWTRVSEDAVALAPRGRSVATVTIRIPADAVRGERYGVVWAEMSTPPSEPGGVTQVSRAGIRLYVSVGPGGAGRTDFDIVSLTGLRDQNNVPVVQATVRNTGERALDLTGSVTLSEGPAGLSAGPFTLPLGRTLGVGDTQPVQVPLDARLPDGPWKVTITVKSGVTTRTGAAVLTFPAGPGSGPEVPAEGEPATLWWAAGGIAGAALVGLLVAYLLRRLARRGHPLPAGPPPD